MASIIDNKTNAAHLFRLPLYFFKDQAPNLKNNFNKTSVIVKLYEDILINLRKNKNDLKEFIEHDLMETMKQNNTKNMIKSDIQFVATVALPEKQENLEEKQNNLRNLCMTTFSRLTSTLDSIQKETKVYFDLNKISNDTAENAKLSGKIKYKKKYMSPIY